MHKLTEVLFSTQDIKLTPSWEAELITMTDLEVLGYVQGVLARVDLLQKRKLKNQLAAILEWDEKTSPVLTVVTKNYLNTLDTHVSEKERVEQQVRAYLRQLYSIYSHIIADYQDQNLLNLDLEEIHLVLARCLNTIFLLAKWSYFVDKPAAPGTWTKVHQIIRMAEDLSEMNKKIFLYSYETKVSSIAILLERAFMLDTLQRESYTPLQFELTDCVLRTWSFKPEISKGNASNNEYQFFIHLANENRPQRLRSVKDHPDFRYWRTSNTVELIEQYISAVSRNKPLDDFNLANLAPTPDIVKLFKKLRMDWRVEGYQRQRRESERVNSNRTLKVCFGLDKVLAYVKTQHSSEALEDLSLQVDGDEVETITLGGESDAISTAFQQSGNNGSLYGFETWKVVDESKNGFAVELTGSIGNQVKNGALIGYTTSDNEQVVAVAEIKSVKKLGKGKCRVGLSRMSHNVSVARVSRLYQTEGPASTSAYAMDDIGETFTFKNEFSALFLGSDDETKFSLIIPTMQYLRAGRYKVSINGQHYIVLAGDVLSMESEWTYVEAVGKTLIN